MVKFPKSHCSKEEIINFLLPGMTTATTAQWTQVRTLFLAEQDAQEKVKLMTALGKTTDAALLTQYIQSGEDRQTIRDQDYFTFIQSIAANPVGEPLVWAYVKQNWPALVARFGLNERNLGRMIPSITGRFSTEAQLEDLKAFFAQYPDAGAGATARVQAIETIENNIKWLATNQKAVSDFLDTVVVVP
jgi:glutamyl aminopeptidase